MIRLMTLLAESAITDNCKVNPVGEVTCKWDTGNTTRASALHAQDIQVQDGKVAWTFKDQPYSAELHGYSTPSGRDKRPVIATTLEWRDKTISVLIALVDRSNNTADLLCNMDVMQALGIQIDTRTMQAYTKD